MSNTISFKHSGNTGDIIYALAGMKHICEKLGKKADIHLWLDRKGTYYEGAKHPLGEFIFNGHMYRNLKPLLLAQPWVNSVVKYAGQTIHVDLDLIRQRDVNMPYGHIARWYFYVFPDMACDLSMPWILTGEGETVAWEDAIIVNRTQRYQNPHIAYSFLRKYKNVVFVGTQGEYRILSKQVPTMQYVEFPNFLNLAFAIKHCKVFIGNQSMCFGLAEAVKAPRILEVCSFAPNVIPEGPGPAYDFYSQAAFEHYVDEMVNGVEKVREPMPIKSGPLEGKVVPLHDWSESRFAKDSTDNWFCRDEDMDIINNTLVDVPRLVNIEKYVKQTENLEGLIAEIGVYKGGTALLIRKTAVTKGIFLYDTFNGMPIVDDERDLHHTGDFGDTSLDHILSIFTKYASANIFRTATGAMFPTFNGENGYVSVEKGIFPSGVNVAMIDDALFSFVHIDVDIYQSVKDCLEFFYPRMVQGGIICVDDYNAPSCPGAKLAFDEFMKDKIENPQVYAVPNYMDCQSQRAFVKL